MKLGHLIECNMRNVFPKINIQNVMEKLVLDPFIKN